MGGCECRCTTRVRWVVCGCGLGPACSSVCLSVLANGWEAASAGWLGGAGHYQFRPICSYATHAHLSQRSRGCLLRRYLCAGRCKRDLRLHPRWQCGRHAATPAGRAATLEFMGEGTGLPGLAGLQLHVTYRTLAPWYGILQVLIISTVKTVLSREL